MPKGVTYVEERHAPLSHRATSRGGGRSVPGLVAGAQFTGSTGILSLNAIASEDANLYLCGLLKQAEELEASCNLQRSDGRSSYPK